MAEMLVSEELANGIPQLKDAQSEERVSVASNWKLVWWRFRKNRLALFSLAILIFFYIIVLFPDFFAVSDPEATDARLTFVPAQGLHLIDGSSIRLWVPALVGKRNPDTLAMEWKTDGTRKSLSIFSRKVIHTKYWDYLKADLHLLGPVDTT